MATPEQDGSTTSVADGIEHPLDPRYIALQRRVGWVTAAVRSLVLLGGVIAALEFASLPAAAPVPLLLAWLLAAAALVWLGHQWPAISYRHASYRVDADGIEIRRGVLWREIVNVPRSRVQHTDVAQGPWERQFGLGTLSVFTAGTRHAQVSLPGLSHERALRIREHLLPRAADDVV
jgi:membrane protein YdbS with pleckstrin-like domain